MSDHENSLSALKRTLAHIDVRMRMKPEDIGLDLPPVPALPPPRRRSRPVLIIDNDRG
jgi:hypothetical protein